MIFPPGPLLGAPLSFPGKFGQGPGCANTVVVTSLDQLPTPVGDTITLVDDTEYRICGQLQLGQLDLALEPGAVLSGSDPLLDSIVGNPNAFAQVDLTQGGTVRDLAIGAPEGKAAVNVGNANSATENAVLWNLSVGGSVGVFLQGAIQNISIARVFGKLKTDAIAFKNAQVFGASIANSVFQVGVQAGPPPSRGVLIDGASVISNLALSNLLFQFPDANNIGIEAENNSQVAVARVASCAYMSPVGGVPARIFQAGGLPTPVGLGAASNWEAAGCVGFSNTITRAGMQLTNELTDFSGEAPGTFLRLGTGGGGGSYVLQPDPSRYDLQGATAPSQSLRYIGSSPCPQTVICSISAALDTATPVFSPRILSARMLIDGVQVGDSFEATTPDFVIAAPVSIAFSRSATLAQNNEITIELANLTDDASVQTLSASVTASP